MIQEGRSGWCHRVTSVDANIGNIFLENSMETTHVTDFSYPLTISCQSPADFCFPSYFVVLLKFPVAELFLL